MRARALAGQQPAGQRSYAAQKLNNDILQAHTVRSCVAMHTSIPPPHKSVRKHYLTTTHRPVVFCRDAKTERPRTPRRTACSPALAHTRWLFLLLQQLVVNPFLLSYTKPLHNTEPVRSRRVCSLHSISPIHPRSVGRLTHTRRAVPPT